MITIPHHHLQRLSRLALATEGREGAVLANISLSVRGGVARFAATTGKILVCCLIGAPEEPDRELVLDAGQFTTAMKAAAKHKGRSASLTIKGHEARVESGGTASLVRVLDLQYPPIDFVFEHTADQVPVPAVGSYDPSLLGLAQKLLGLKSLFLVSMVHPASSLPAVWRDDADTTSTGDLKTACNSPGLWTDGSWAVLVMPVSRQLPEQQDFVHFAIGRTTPVTAAA